MIGMLPSTGVKFSVVPRDTFFDEESLRAFGTSVFGIQTMLRMIRLPEDALRRQTGTVDADAWYRMIPPGMLFIVRAAAEIALHQHTLMMNDRGLEVFVHLWNSAIWEFCGLLGAV